jgi:hypothetical protein
MYACYSELAHVLRENGEVEEPLSIYRNLLPKWKDLGHRAAVAHELECTAYLLRRKEQSRQATLLLSAADALRKMIESVPTTMEKVEYEKEIASLRSGMQESEFKKAWEEGYSLSMDEAIALAIREE